MHLNEMCFDLIKKEDVRDYLKDYACIFKQSLTEDD